MVKKILYVIFGILFASSLAASFYFYRQYTALSQAKNSPQQTQGEARRLIDAVGRLMILPTDEQPTIATVANLDALRDQPFFANAKEGDKVLIYTNANKAILYDPVQNKIVEVAPISIGQAPTSTVQSSSTSSSTAKDSLTPSKMK